MGHIFTRARDIMRTSVQARLDSTMATCQFKCIRCGALITRPLSELPADTPVNVEDGQDHVPTGTYATNPEDNWTGMEGWYVVNLADAIDTQRHPDIGRLNGCCGLDGLDGRNTVCANGHEVGVEKSDCWMSHCLLLDPEAVEIVRAVQPQRPAEAVRHRDDRE